MTNTIIWSGKIGIDIRGAANIISGVHTYNLANTLGGIGILVDDNYGQLRFIGCYFDYNDIVLVAPVHLISIQDTFFLGGAKVILQSNMHNASVTGLSIRDSQYVVGGYKNGIPSTVVLNETAGKFGVVKDVFIDDVMILNDGYKLKTSKYGMKLSLQNAQQWVFDFSDVLLFDVEMVPIEWVDYTLQFDEIGNGVNVWDYKHILRKAEGMKVIIETNMPCNATVYVTVDQSKYT